MNHETSRETFRRSSRKVSFWEVLLILMVILTVPLQRISYKAIQTGTWDVVEAFRMTSETIAIVFALLLVLNYILKKPYLAITFGCHQKHCRSFKWFGKPFVLCARCTGILVGVWLTPLLAYFSIHPSWYLLGIIPIALDGWIQYLSRYESTNIRRFITGLVFAPAFMTILTFNYYFMGKIFVKLALWTLEWIH